MTLYDCNELKKQLVETKDFAGFHDYFLTNFVEKGRFMDMGRALSRPRGHFLTSALGEAYLRATDLEGTIISSRLVELPEFGLIHGAVTVNGKLGSVVYFEDLEMGMFTVVENMRTGETKYVRFTAHRPTPEKPS